MGKSHFPDNYIIPIVRYPVTVPQIFGKPVSRRGNISKKFTPAGVAAPAGTVSLTGTVPVISHNLKIITK
jgi:hypothetical protein